MRLDERLPRCGGGRRADRRRHRCDPGFGAAWAELADVELALGQLGEAEKAANEAVRLDAKQAEWHGLLARIYAGQKRSDDALREAEAALEIVGNLASAKLVEADVLAERGEIDPALEAYQVAFGFARQRSHPAGACRQRMSDRRAGDQRQGVRRSGDRALPAMGPWVGRSGRCARSLERPDRGHEKRIKRRFRRRDRWTGRW